MKKTLPFLFLVLLILNPSIANAHVNVRPDSVPVGSFQTFTISVPSEKDLPTTEVRILLPDDLEFVTPTVKSGWTIDILTHNFPSGPHPYELIWKNGTIPAHYRDDFSFSAKVPPDATTLAWKAYQKYSDGSVVSWELAPGDKQPANTDGTPDFSQVGPYSQTLVVDDLSEKPKKSTADINTALSVSAIAIALASFFVSMQRKKK